MSVFYQFRFCTEVIHKHCYRINNYPFQYNVNKRRGTNNQVERAL